MDKKKIVEKILIMIPTIGLSMMAILVASAICAIWGDNIVLYSKIALTMIVGIVCLSVINNSLD